MTQRLPHRRGFTWIELLVVIGIVVLVISIVIPTINRMRQSSGNSRCPSNLRQIGQALLLYANDNRGAYPRTRTSAGPVRVPTWGTGAAATQPFAPDGPAVNDVTAAVFLLLRTQDITAHAFICPSTDTVADAYAGLSPAQRSNFTDLKKNLSYSFQNFYPDEWIVRSDVVRGSYSDFAVAADMNAGTAGFHAVPENVLAPTVTSSPKEMKQGNSRNHDRDGQNVLYADGHVAWADHPFVGDGRDNIYRTQHTAIMASPSGRSDSILLPTDD